MDGSDRWIVAGEEIDGDRSTKDETSRCVVKEEAIGYDEWTPKGLKKGSAACRWIDELMKKKNTDAAVTSVG